MQQNSMQQGQIDIKNYYSDVEYLARAMARRIPSGVPFDDLLAAGYLGLVDAVQKFDSGRQSSFRTYAMFRIRGAIFDELRKGDHVPRLVRADLRRLKAVVNSFASLNGRQPVVTEIAEMMNLKTAKVEELLNWRQVALVPFELIQSDASVERSETNAAASLFETEDSRELCEILSLLAKRDRDILVAVYLHERKMADVAKAFQVSESRVSQIVARSLKLLRKRVSSRFKNRAIMPSMASG